MTATPKLPPPRWTFWKTAIAAFRISGAGHTPSPPPGGLWIDKELPCLSPWERWPSEARTERGNQGAMPSQSPAVTALPEGEPRGVYPGTKNGAYLHRYAPFAIFRKQLSLFRVLCDHHVRPVVLHPVVVIGVVQKRFGHIFGFRVVLTVGVAQHGGGSEQTVAG